MTNSDGWLTLEQLSAELQVPLATVYAWRARRVGPPAYKIGKHVRVKRSDLEAWIAARRDDQAATL